MIKGIGCDIVDISRIERLRILHEKEQAIALPQLNKIVEFEK